MILQVFNKFNEMIKTSIKNHVAWVLLDRPQQKNALSVALLMHLVETLKVLDANSDVRAIVLYGQPDFSAGGDIRDMQTDSLQEAQALASKVQSAYMEIEQIGKPLLAYTSGLVFGGGFELALVCDFIVSHTSAIFSLPETALGIVPGGGATQRLKHRVGKQNAAFILMTGQRFSADRMFEMGLIQSLVKDDSEVEDLLKPLVKNNAKATATIKKLLRYDSDFSAESKAFAELSQTEGKVLMQRFFKK